MWEATKMLNGYERGTRVPAQIVLLFLAFTVVSVSNARSVNPDLDDVFQLLLGPFLANFDTKVTVQ
jgi:hypothetical protein